MTVATRAPPPMAIADGNVNLATDKPSNNNNVASLSPAVEAAVSTAEFLSADAVVTQDASVGGAYPSPAMIVQPLSHSGDGQESTSMTSLAPASAEVAIELPPGAVEAGRDLSELFAGEPALCTEAGIPLTPTTERLSVTQLTGVEEAPVSCGAVSACSSCFGNSVAASPFTAMMETGGAPLIDMAESELVALLQEGAAGLRRLTPRTLEACAEEGIDPVELLPRTPSDFAPRDLKVVLSVHHQQARCERFETRRASKLQDVLLARRRVVDTFTIDSIAVNEEGFASTLVEERRREADASRAAAEKRERIFEEHRQRAQASSSATQQRALEVQKRFGEYDRKRQAERQARATSREARREIQEARIARNKAEADETVIRRAAESGAHEARRTARMQLERTQQEQARRLGSQAKEEKAEKGQEEKAAALALRKEQLDEVIADRQVRMAAHAKKLNLQDAQRVRDGIERQCAIDRVLCEVDAKEQAHIEHTRARLEAKPRSSAVRGNAGMLQQQQKVHHAHAAASSRQGNEARLQEEAQRIAQHEHEKETRRHEMLAARAEAMADAAEKRHVRQEEIKERVRRQTRKREYQREAMRRQQQARDAKHFAQRDALDQLHREKLAIRHQLAAVSDVGTRPTMRDMEIASEPGPTSVDNRFYQVGQRGPGGKFARIGIQKAPPAYTFGR